MASARSTERMPALRACPQCPPPAQSMRPLLRTGCAPVRSVRERTPTLSALSVRLNGPRQRNCRGLSLLLTALPRGLTRAASADAPPHGARSCSCRSPPNSLPMSRSGTTPRTTAQASIDSTSRLASAPSVGSTGEHLPTGNPASTSRTRRAFRSEKRANSAQVSNRLRSSPKASFAKCSRISSTDHGSFSRLVWTSSTSLSTPAKLSLKEVPRRSKNSDLLRTTATSFVTERHP